MDEKIIHNQNTDAVVIMLKDKLDGLFEKELGVYHTEEYNALICGAFAIETDSGYDIFLKLTTGRDVEDWEFDAIYDYYDEATILTEAEIITEAENCHNPTWEASVFVKDKSLIQEKLLAVLRLHFLELQSVYEAIADKEDEYL